MQWRAVLGLGGWDEAGGLVPAKQRRHMGHRRHPHGFMMSTRADHSFLTDNILNKNWTSFDLRSQVLAIGQS